MGYYFEIWSRPGDPNFGRVIYDPPFREASLSDAVNELGGGRMQLPSSFDRFDDILLVDRTNLANSVSSLVRCIDDVTNEIVNEWLPASINPTATKNDPYVDVSGRGIKEVLTFARTGPFRSGHMNVLLDGQIPSQPDWNWGGDNVLANGDLESSTVVAKAFEIRIVASAGTYTLSDGTDTTGAIAFNASAGTIEAALEADLGSITDIAVAGAGPGVFVLQMVTPPFGVNLTLDDSGLTGTGTIETTQGGGLQPNPWQRVAALIFGVPQNVGNYDLFDVSSLQNHTPGGQYSLRINPGPVGVSSNRNGGAQQVVNVNPGSLYQAGVWIYPTSGTDEFRLAIFGIGEEIIASTTWGGVTLTPNTWNELTLSDIEIPAGVNQIIFRVQCTNLAPSDPSTFFMDDAYLYEGLPPTTIGDIGLTLYAHYTDPVVQDGVIFWDDGSATDTPYLTCDFDAVNNSAGVPWANPAVSLRVYMRQNFYQVLTKLASDELIEFRVVPDDPEAGTWLLQIYDEGQMDDAPDAALIGGSSDVSRQLRRFRPDSMFMVEGTGRLFAAVQSAPLTGALGKIAAERLVPELVEGPAALDAALADETAAPINGLVYSYELVQPQQSPGTDYLLGDTVYVHDPPEADGPGRFWSWTVTFNPDQVRHEVDFLATEDGS